MRFVVALAISVGLHAVLAIGLTVALSHAPEPQTSVTLDLSSVDLSFADDECESATVAAPPATPPTCPAPPPEANPPVAKPPPPSIPLPPEVGGTLDYPEPKETGEKMLEVKVDEPPRPCRTIKPDYPRGARQRGEQGDVQLEISVGADGRVDSVRIVKSCGYAELDASAEKAVREARFVPATSDGHPVSSTARLTLRFTLK